MAKLEVELSQIDELKQITSNVNQIVSLVNMKRDIDDSISKLRKIKPCTSIDYDVINEDLGLNKSSRVGYLIACYIMAKGLK